MWAFINCIECHTPRMLFEHTINQWCDWTPSYENKYTGVRRIDNIHQFVKAIQEGVALDDERTVQFGDSETRYLVLDRAERLRDMGSTLIYSLLRLAEMVMLFQCMDGWNDWVPTTKICRQAEISVLS